MPKDASFSDSSTSDRCCFSKSSRIKLPLTHNYVARDAPRNIPFSNILSTNFRERNLDIVQVFDHGFPSVFCMVEAFERKLSSSVCYAKINHTLIAYIIYTLYIFYIYTLLYYIPCIIEAFVRAFWKARFLHSLYHLCGIRI